MRGRRLPVVVYDCDRCGLCCTELIIEASIDDALREQRIADECVLMDGHGTIPLVDACFSIACGKARPCPFGSRDGQGKHVCAIQATKPGVCLGFMPGNPKCRELREANELKPLEPRPAVSLADRIRATVTY